jgi:hypothetical protein
MRVINGFKLRQLIRIVVVSVLASAQMFLIAHACAISVDKLASHAKVMTTPSFGVALVTKRRVTDGGQYQLQLAAGDCADSIVHPELTNQFGVWPHWSRVVPRVSTDSPPVVFGQVHSSLHRMADHVAIASGLPANPQLPNRLPHTILHCCWRI